MLGNEPMPILLESTVYREEVNPSQNGELTPSYLGGQRLKMNRKELVSGEKINMQTCCGGKDHRTNVLANFWTVGLLMGL